MTILRESLWYLAIGAISVVQVCRVWKKEDRFTLGLIFWITTLCAVICAMAAHVYGVTAIKVISWLLMLASIVLGIVHRSRRARPPQE